MHIKACKPTMRVGIGGLVAGQFIGMSQPAGIQCKASENVGKPLVSTITSSQHQTADALT